MLLEKDFISNMRYTILKDRVRGFRSSGVVIHDGKILLMHQIFRGEDFYNLPGGGCEENETLEDACRREIREEFNIDVIVGRLIYILDSPRRLNFVFVCEYLGGDISLGGPEGVRMKQDDQYFVEWVDLKILKQINLQPKITKECLQKYLENPEQVTFFGTTTEYVNKKILLIAPQYFTIPPVGYGGIERVVTLAYLHYVSAGYQVDIISRSDSKFHTHNLEDLFSMNLSDYKFVLSFYYKESVLRFLDKQDPQLYVLLENNFKDELNYLTELDHSKMYVLSSDQQKQYEEHLGQRYDIIPNGVDMKQFVILDTVRSRDIVFIGGIGQHKSPLSCLNYAIEHNLSIDFFGPLIFTQDEYNYKDAFMEKLESYTKAQLLGELTDDREKVRLLNAYKYFIFLPGVDKDSWVEPFGLAPLEAMACGCTVITQYDSGGHRSFCNKQNSISYKENPKVLDSKEIRDSILSYDFERIFKVHYPK